MKISIITVVLNNIAFIEDAIVSVLQQTHPETEYIIIDGGSTDGSLELINSYKNRVTKVISEPDKGIYDAMNKGLAIASGEIIGFLNADDFYTDDTVIARISRAFESNNCDALYADLDYVSARNKHKIVRKWRSGPFSKKRFLAGWMPPHPTFFAKKTVYDKLGGYNQQLNVAADYELMLRFLFFNETSVGYIPEVTVKMRLGGHSNRTLTNRMLANIQDRRAWTINGFKPKWYTLLLKPFSKIFQYFK